MPAATTPESKPARHRPKSYTVFAAAFLAGAAAAVGVNRVLDVHVAQRRPQVECEPIFVALRPLPQGSPVTVWDVALKDWPKAMLPTSALRAGDTFEGCVLRHAVREGQPLLALQLVRTGSGDGQASAEAFVPAVPVTTTATAELPAAADLWTPAAAPAQASPIVTGSTAPAPTAVVTTPTPERTTVAQAMPMEEPAPVAIVTPAEPALVATMEPEPVAPPAETPIAPSPASVPASDPSTLAAQPTPTAPEEVEDDTAEAVATDVTSMPSVMTQPATGSQAPSRPTSGDAGRFLVVPERIALQADTSFTTPRPQPPGPPTSPATAAPGKTRPQSRSASQPDNRRGGQPAPQPRQATQPRSQQQPQQAQPHHQQPSAQQQQSTAARKPWGGMFPNVAAGIDAIGGQWQRSRSTAGQPQRGDQPVSR